MDKHDGTDDVTVAGIAKFNYELGTSQDAKKAVRETKKANPDQIGSVYFHISNSGVTFQVIDEGYGPTIVVRGGSFGNMNNSFKLHTDADSLKILGEMFIAAAKHGNFSEEYVCKASARPAKFYTTGQLEEKK